MFFHALNGRMQTARRKLANAAFPYPYPRPVNPDYFIRSASRPWFTHVLFHWLVPYLGTPIRGFGAFSHRK